MSTSILCTQLHRRCRESIERHQITSGANFQDSARLVPSTDLDGSSAVIAMSRNPSMIRACRHESVVVHHVAPHDLEGKHHVHVAFFEQN
jgi:hypothetical protein